MTDEDMGKVGIGGSKAALVLERPTIVCIASACHGANIELRRACGEEVEGVGGLKFPLLPQEKRDSLISGVNAILANPSRTAEQSHESWLKFKQSRGWEYGPVQDDEKKEHPCMVSYDLLPGHQKIKDALFKSIVLTLARGFLDAASEERIALSKGSAPRDRNAVVPADIEAQDRDEDLDAPKGSS